MTSFFLGYNIATGAGLSFNSATNVLSNSGVLSLQGDTGSLSLTAGTGISISGLTISNAGIVSASAGDGITVSGTNPLKITNSGVLSLQGDTGALSLSAGSGIGISGLTISNNGVLGIAGSTTSFLTGDVTLKAGSDISISQSTSSITISNTYSLPSGVLTNSSTYVKSLGGSSGALSLVAGSGIGVSGLTITNDGVTSLTGGTGITVSGSTGGVTITNSGITSLSAGDGISVSGSTITNAGVLSLQGDTGALSLSAGTGIGISGLTISNDGVLGIAGGTTSFLSGKVTLKAGSNISLSQSTTSITIGNSYSLPSDVLTSSSTYVKSLDGSSGALSLVAGTGIGISGLTITNDGVTSLTAGTAISLSGSTGGITVTNSGVTSLQGSTGSLSLTAGTGIGISGLTISNTGVTSITAGTNITISGSTGDVTIDSSGSSYTAGDGITISGTTIEMSGSYSGTFSASSDFGIPFASNSGGESLYLGSSAWGGSLPSGSSATGISGFSFTGGSGSQVFTFSSVSGQTAINTDGSFFAGDGGFTYNPFGTNYATDGDILANGNIAGGGSLGINGNASISGSLTAQYIDSNINNDNPNGTTPTVVLSIWGHGQGDAVSSFTTFYGLGISDSTLDFLTNGNFAWWYNDTQIASMNGSGDMSIAGTATGGFAQFFNSGTIRVSVQALSYSITLPAGTWAGFITVGIFFVPSSSTYSYQIGVNFSGSAFVSGTVYGSSALTNIAGGSGQNYPLDDFPPIPLEIESSGGTITFNIVDLDGTAGMTSIFGGNTDNAFQVNVFLVSTSTAS